MPEETERIKYIRDNQTKSVVLAQELIKELPNLVKSEDDLYAFNGKYYDLVSDDHLKCQFNDFVLKYGIIARWKSAVINEVLIFIKTYSGIKKVNMNGNPDLLCLNNGVFNISTEEFIPHSSNIYFDTYINIDYDKEAGDCPVFVNFLMEVLGKNKEAINNVLRLGGYLLDYSPDNMKKCNKMFLFDGAGGSGKSTLLDTFSLLFSKDQTSALTLDQLAGDIFEKDKLITSRFNITSEQKRSYVDAEEIKKIVSGEYLEIKRKFLPSVTIRSKTKIVVACNGLPKFNDTSEGIYRRLVIFKFKNQYKNEYEYNRISDPDSSRIYKQDRQLFSKIEKEKTAILNLFLEGLKILKDDNFQFLEGTDFVNTMEEFKNDNDAAREFLKEKFVADNNSFTPVKEVFDEFRAWHVANVGGGNFKFRSNEMGKRIKEVFNIDSNGQRYFTINGEVEFLRTYPLKKIKYDLPTAEAQQPDGFFDGTEIVSRNEDSLSQECLGL